VGCSYTLDGRGGGPRPRPCPSPAPTGRFAPVPGARLGGPPGAPGRAGDRGRHASISCCPAPAGDGIELDPAHPPTGGEPDGEDPVHVRASLLAAAGSVELRGARGRRRGFRGGRRRRLLGVRPCGAPARCTRALLERPGPRPNAERPGARTRGVPSPRARRIHPWLPRSCGSAPTKARALTRGRALIQGHRPARASTSRIPSWPAGRVGLYLEFLTFLGHPPRRWRDDAGDLLSPAERGGVRKPATASRSCAPSIDPERWARGVGPAPGSRFPPPREPPRHRAGGRAPTCLAKKKGRRSAFLHVHHAGPSSTRSGSPAPNHHNRAGDLAARLSADAEARGAAQCPRAAFPGARRPCHRSTRDFRPFWQSQGPLRVGPPPRRRQRPVSPDQDGPLRLGPAGASYPRDFDEPRSPEWAKARGPDGLHQPASGVPWPRQVSLLEAPPSNPAPRRVALLQALTTAYGPRAARRPPSCRRAIAGPRARFEELLSAVPIFALLLAPARAFGPCAPPAAARPRSRSGPTERPRRARAMEGDSLFLLAEGALGGWLLRRGPAGGRTWSVEHACPAAPGGGRDGSLLHRRAAQRHGWRAGRRRRRPTRSGPGSNAPLLGDHPELARRAGPT